MLHMLLFFSIFAFGLGLKNAREMDSTGAVGGGYQAVGELPIVEVVEHFGGRKVSLKGEKGQCLCPLHEDKRPSFSVDTAKNAWYCFSCGKGGGPVQFVMEQLGCDWQEAVRALATWRNIPLTGNRNTEQERQAMEEQQEYRKAFTKLSQYFHTQLLTATGAEEARQYVLQRWGSLDVAKYWQLGYCPNIETRDYLQVVDPMCARKEVAEALLVNCHGLRGRLVFPISDRWGRVCGFSGRALPGSASSAKYWNSPTSAIFHKGELLYGLQKASKSIKETGHVYLVEGYADCIRLHSIGVTNSVARMGTALTDSQAKTLQALANDVIIIPDSDKAGMQSLKVMAWQLLTMGVPVSYINLPLGPEKNDADSLFPSLEVFTRYAKESCRDYYLEYYKFVLSEQHPGTRYKKLQELWTLYSGLPASVQQVYGNLQRPPSPVGMDNVSVANRYYCLLSNDARLGKQMQSHYVMEESVLGALLTDGNLYPEVSHLLQPEFFCDPYYREIYKTIGDLGELGYKTDSLSVEHAVVNSKSGVLAHYNYIETARVLNSLKIASREKPADSLYTHIEALVRDWKHGQLQQYAQALGPELASMGPLASTQELQEKILDPLEQIILREQELRALTMEEATEREYGLLQAEWEAVARREYPRRAYSNYPTLDFLTQGWRGGNMVVIAARPSIGKTAFALNIAYNLAEQLYARQDYSPLLFFSLEMTQGEMLRRLWSLHSNLNISLQTPPSEQSRIADAAMHTKQLNLQFIDRTNRITDIVAKARRASRRKSLGAVFVDYLQLVRSNITSKNATREQEVGNTSRVLKELAQELDVPVFVLSQLNRAVENTNSRRPTLAHLRESGAIEQDADMVIMLHSEERVKHTLYPDRTDTQGKIEAYIEKSRNGRLGSVFFDFYGPTMRFVEENPQVDHNIP